MEKQKFYYIDANGNRKKYVGNVIKQSDGTYKGLLTTTTLEYNTVNLQYHPAVDYVEGNSPYYTYTNSDGYEARYYSFHKTDELGNEYFSYTTFTQLPLNFHPANDEVSEYFTYTDKAGNEKLFIGTPIYNKAKNTYTGNIK